MPQTTIESTASGDFSFTEIDNSRKADDDSFSMSFTEETSGWKINHSGADEWVWLTSLAGKTLCQITASPTDVFNSSDTYYITPSMVVSHGNNPLYFERNNHEKITKRWDLDESNSLILSCGVAQDWTGQWNFIFGGNSSQSFANGLYGGDVLVAVNHATMQARVVIIAYTNGGHTIIQRAISSNSSGNMNTAYYSLSKFF